ncbi:MAG: hypothetical protein HQL37_15760 [Alphaproteobacteria bacterium]|nr:hypothetical protein [Alphaproteobacteria bacterium]
MDNHGASQSGPMDGNNRSRENWRGDPKYNPPGMTQEQLVQMLAMMSMLGGGNSLQQHFNPLKMFSGFAAQGQDKPFNPMDILAAIIMHSQYSSLNPLKMFSGFATNFLGQFVLLFLNVWVDRLTIAQSVLQQRIDWYQALLNNPPSGGIPGLNTPLSGSFPFPGSINPLSGGIPGKAPDDEQNGPMW